MGSNETNEMTGQAGRKQANPLSLFAVHLPHKKTRRFRLYPSSKPGQHEQRKSTEEIHASADARQLEQTRIDEGEFELTIGSFVEMAQPCRLHSSPHHNCRLSVSRSVAAVF